MLHVCIKISDAIIITISSIDYIVLCIDDWRCDQLRWSNQGVQKLPRKDPTIKKSYFFISSSSGPSKLFMKHAFELLAPNDVPTVLIHYIGDEKCAVPHAHGNATRDSTRKYIRTCPSVIQSLKYGNTIETAVKSYRNHGNSCEVLPKSHLRSPISATLACKTSTQYKTNNDQAF